MKKYLISSEFKTIPADYKDVCDVISDQKIVALFQGKSEAGPRALGNRSILFDPRNPNAQTHVNKVKKREWFRPFAGTILIEYASEWVELQGLDESPFMMYAFQINEKKKHLIPGIIHADGSCRMQTVTEQQNPHFYRLIKTFYEKTGVPILFNTSFNLGGEVLVHTIEDALDTLERSDIDYLYIPEDGHLICTY
jgi:carbamoyltransferase